MDELIRELQELKNQLNALEAQLTSIIAEAKTEPYSGLQAALERLEGREARARYFEAFL